MPIPKSLILLTLGLIAIGNAAATVVEPNQTNSAQKIATIAKMYEQDINNEGMDNPVVLQQYANAELQAAMQLEQDYFVREQISCHIGYDVLWDSQDPDYAQDKQLSMTDKGLVQVSLAQGSQVYYDLTCDGTDKEAKCQVADVILNEDGESLKEYLLKTCR